MEVNSWDMPLGAMANGNAMAILNVLYLMIEKGIITQAEAAGVLTKTANQVRDGSEDGSAPEHGERVAQAFEQMASWCLGMQTKP
ncbi:MAG: hypothetical protein ACTHNH_08440 [Mesorhizobium sp.]